MRAIPVLVLLCVLSACGADAATAGPTIFVALDEEFSRPVLERFTKELGITLVQQYDTESTKTVGLVSRIREEAANPRCSVFWNNELAHTVHLAKLGLLEAYESPSARDVPAEWRDPGHRWTGFAARARILIVNTELLPDPAQWPKSYKDLVDPKWKGRCAVAYPVRGTTLTHFTALRLLLGDEAFAKFLDAMVANDVKFRPSNGATMKETCSGAVAWAFTDTDDYHTARLRGHKVACVFPDQEEGGLGTMLIPNSVAIIKGGPDLPNSKRLVDKILARETEALLAAAEGAQIPLRGGVEGPKDPAIRAFGAFKAMAWDIEATAANLARCNQEFSKRFGQ
ncbi:MAG TPA: extracellular solute-binding protein [Planctomycetota bacterium]